MAAAIASFALISRTRARPDSEPALRAGRVRRVALLADAANNATFPLSSAFSVSEAPALRRCVPRARTEGGRARRRAQGAASASRCRWSGTAPSPSSTLENKLLRHRRGAGIPHLRPIYGALAPDGGAAGGGGGWVGTPRRRARQRDARGDGRVARVGGPRSRAQGRDRRPVAVGAVFDRVVRKAFDAYLIGRASPRRRRRPSAAHSDACRGRAIASRELRAAAARPSASALNGVLASGAEAFMNSSTPWGSASSTGVLVELRYDAVSAVGARAPLHHGVGV